MIKTGLSLINKTEGVEVQCFGFGPISLNIPRDKIQVPGVADEGWEFGDYRLVGRWEDINVPSKWHSELSRTAVFDGEKTVVTATFSDLPNIVPDKITPRQARLALNAKNLLEVVERAVSQQSKDVQIAWEFSAFIHRSDPTVVSMGQMLSIDLDDLFRIASEL